MNTYFKLHSNEREIITGLQEGGIQRKGAERRLFESFFYIIKQGITKYSISEDEATSAYSDTIISVIDNIVANKFEGQASLKSYTYKIFYNKCVDTIRKATTNKSKVHNTAYIDDFLSVLPDKTKNVIEQMIERSQRSLLTQKIEEIGEKCKQLLLLFEDGYTDKEIAKIMLYNSSDVAKTSRLRCLEKLREKVKLL
jgi:RNA polymerase sigma factor (sigma-70 family)